MVPLISVFFNLRADYLTTLELRFIDGRHDLFIRPGLGHLAGQLYGLFARYPSLNVVLAARFLGVTIWHTVTICS